MPRVGLFEVHEHPFFLYYLSRIADGEHNWVTVFVPQSTHDRIRPLYTDAEHESIAWVLVDDGEVDRLFGRAERAASDDLDILWVNTAWGTGQMPANHLEFDPDCPSVAGITNLNDWMYNPLPRPVYGTVEPLVRLLKRVPSRVSTPVFQHLRYLMQPGILSNHDGVNVEYPPMRRFVEERRPPGLSVYGLPPVVYEAEKLPDPGEDDGLRVAVPGRISPYIRDYDLVFDAVEPLFETYGSDLTLDLVGEPRDDSGPVVERIDELAARGFDVEYRTEWVPFEAFARALRRADVLLDPVRVHRRIRHPLRVDQETGRRNGTGVLFDAIRYARPLLLPEAFPWDPMLDPFARSFRSADHLRSILRGLLEDPAGLAEWQATVTEGARAYDPATQRAKFDDIVDDVLAGGGGS